MMEGVLAKLNPGLPWQKLQSTRRIYKTMIRPVVTHSSQTWTLTAKDENNLRIFEMQILRKIFGPINIDNIWRIRSNMETDELIKDADILRFIRAQRIKWLGHIQRMDQDSDGKRISWKTLKRLKLKIGKKQLRTEELGEA
jgi:hypothetical protein